MKLTTNFKTSPVGNKRLGELAEVFGSAEEIPATAKLLYKRSKACSSHDTSKDDRVEIAFGSRIVDNEMLSSALDDFHGKPKQKAGKGKGANNLAPGASAPSSPLLGSIRVM